MFALVVQDAYLRHISKSKCGRYLSLKTSFALNYRNFESSILKKIAVTIKPVYRGDAAQCKATSANNFLRSPKPQSKTHRESFTQCTRDLQLMQYYCGRVLCVPRKNIQCDLPVNNRHHYTNFEFNGSFKQFNHSVGFFDPAPSLYLVNNHLYSGYLFAANTFLQSGKFPLTVNLELSS